MSYLMTFLSLAEVWVGLLGLAAFLALFWVLRGSPIGQAVPTEDDEDSPTGSYRDRVIAAVTVGILLILAGGYLAVTKGIGYSLPAFALGFATVLTLVLMNERYRHGSPSLRRTLSVSTAALNLALVAGTLVVINVIAFRYGGKPLDMTRERAHTLSTLTINQLKTLTQPVVFTTFYGRSGYAAQQKDRVDQLLELYKAANPEMVRLDHVDPFREQTRYDDLVKRARDVELTQGGGVVVEYGQADKADHAIVRTVDLFPGLTAARFDPSASAVKTEFRGEDAITSALIRLRQGTRSIAVFTTGHGEPSVEEMEVGKPGLGFWKSRMNATGWDAVPVNLRTSEMPTGTALVVIVGPTSPFSADEIARLKEYSDRKGPILVIADSAGPAGLDGFLKSFNLEMPGGAVIEPRLRQRGQEDLTLVKPDPKASPIVAPFENEYLILPRPSPLRILTLKNMNPSLLVNVLLRTSKQSTVEKENGPFNVATVVIDAAAKGSSTSGSPRMIVVSSRYMANNTWVQQFPQNLDFLMNSVNWLRVNPTGVGIAPMTHDSMTLTADSVLRTRLVLVPTVMAMILIISVGVLTYLARRQ